MKYPIFVIASQKGVVVIKSGNYECIMLFHARELAEREIGKIQATHLDLGPLHALKVADSAALQEGLESLPADVTCVVWDSTGKPGSHVALDELLQTL